MTATDRALRGAIYPKEVAAGTLPMEVHEFAQRAAQMCL